MAGIVEEEKCLVLTSAGALCAWASLLLRAVQLAQRRLTILDPRSNALWVQLARLDLRQYCLCTLEKRLLHVFARQGTGLQEHELILLGEPARLEKGDFAIVLQVFLVSHEQNDDVGACQSARIRQPVRQGIVRLPAGKQSKRGGGPQIKSQKQETQVLHIACTYVT